jgi:hypothetical protein
MNDILKMYGRPAPPPSGVARRPGRSILGAARGDNDLSANCGARRGILVSGDSPPPPTVGGGYYDLCGVLNLRKVPKDLEDAEFPFGRYIQPARGPREPVGLSEGAIAQHEKPGHLRQVELGGRPRL